MSAQRIIRPDTAFSMGSIKRPRKETPDHLRFVRQLPCVVPGCGRPGEAAHIRYASRIHGKVETGAGRKPDDKWTIPLCDVHHRTGSDAQHGHGEQSWWAGKHIDPIVIAALIWAHSGDQTAAEMVCANATLISGDRK